MITRIMMLLGNSSFRNISHHFMGISVMHLHSITFTYLVHGTPSEKKKVPSSKPFFATLPRRQCIINNLALFH